MPRITSDRAAASARAGIERAAAAIERETDPERIWTAATELADLLERARLEATRLRGRALVRIAREQRLSLSEVADRVGISKARAYQLTRQAADDRPFSLEPTTPVVDEHQDDDTNG